MLSLKGFVFLAWISFGLGSVTTCAAYERTLIFKEPIPDKALPGHVIKTEQVPNEGGCRVKCYLEPNCVSINVGPATEGQLTCELNNHTDDSPPKIPMEEKHGFIHYSVENVCLSNPCHGMNTLCQVGFSDSGYRCACNAGYTSGCQEPLGMENGDITDEQISASSVWDYDHAASRGRLNLQKQGNKRGAWSSLIMDANQWLQIDLRSQHTVVKGVATQGRNDYPQWVTRYKLQHGDDRVNFKYYKSLTGVNKEFDGNTDRDTIVSHDLNPPIRARFIRFRPTVWHGHISMRAELYGCQEKCTIQLRGGVLIGQCTTEGTWRCFY